ncbi:MFS transporter [Mangrovibrevibacter kandeliae]|uniref:MFS transporter n=1 Tax=Mangrovibrevibacter kandeliae TaxID=2968473 RepID=UPI0021181640|nr:MULTISPECIES: MFS transporter [unclassified Aurantimonas]MCQ8781487.1 MFS transporter [Aurantimonas sp. CSK15Z-1]MCW4114264.1 MFS transporter [Aurantimonas sp. MSK8Z-1]
MTITQSSGRRLAEEGGGISAGLTVLVAFSCGALAANLYYAQPLVALIGESLGLPRAAESAIVTFTQIGYCLGLVLLVPLGDVLENRRLIIVTMIANVAALIGLTFVPSVAILFGAMLVVGVTSTAAQMLLPLAAHLAPPAERGRIVGNVMSGLLLGILLARPVASFLAEYVGWRGVFALSAGAVALAALACAVLVPTRRPSHRHSYGELIVSLGRLFLREPVLRHRALYHAAMFGVFTVFWTAAPLILLREPYDFSPSGVALFALSGVLGVVAAPVTGRLADRGHTVLGTVIAMLLVIGAFVAALFGQTSLVALVFAGVILDLGVQANMVISQREIYQLDAAIRSRLNAVYLAVFFLGGALGSALTSPVLERFGWVGICILGLVPPALALVSFLALDAPRRAGR